MRRLAYVGTTLRMMNLAEIVVVNENRDPAAAGDVTIFRNADAACRYLEHWWVEDGEGWAFTASGERLTLGVNEREQVVVLDREPAPDGLDLVHQWLRVAASAVLEARRSKAARGKVIPNASEEDARLPASVKDLIAYVGFTG